MEGISEGKEYEGSWIKLTRVGYGLSSDIGYVGGN
jgi:hypothetical protein